MKKLYTLFFVLITALSFSQVMTYSIPGNYVYTVPAGVTSLTVEVVGAGGRGQGNGTGGGGGGGYAAGVFSVVPGSTLAVRVGSPGVNPSVGTSSIGGLGIIATGGANGVTVSNPNVGGGGAGGIGSGGLINNTGGTGGGGYFTYFGGGGGGAAGPLGNGGNGGNVTAYTGTNCLQPGGSAGTSGGAPGGNGGKGAGFTNSSCSTTDPAANGQPFGGGGGGGNGIGSTPGNGGGGSARFIAVSSTGIAEHAKQNIIVYPNPFTDKLNVISKKNESYELRNALGQLVYSGKEISEQDFSGLPKGIYILSAVNSNSTIKLIKQ
jgi:hypothetical protein